MGVNIPTLVVEDTGRVPGGGKGIQQEDAEEPDDGRGQRRDRGQRILKRIGISPLPGFGREEARCNGSLSGQDHRPVMTTVMATKGQ